MEGKKKRGANYSDTERDIFAFDILPKYKEIIENKMSDAVTRGEKAAAWESLAADFNNKSSASYRSVDSLKGLWDNMKKAARKAKGRERTETFMTGGGQRDPKGEPSKVDLAVLTILGPSAEGLHNICDGDHLPASCTSSAAFGIENVPPESESPDVSVLGSSKLDMSLLENSNTDISVLDESNATNLLSADSPQPAVITQSMLTVALASSSDSGNWSEYLPKMLYGKKPDALRVEKESSLNSNCSTMEISKSTKEEVRKRTKAEEMEWVKQCKRRRPDLPVVDTKTASDLAKAKLELTTVTKNQIIAEDLRRVAEEKRHEAEELRRAELFRIEKEKKELEAEILRMQLAKLKQEVGLQK